VSAPVENNGATLANIEIEKAVLGSLVNGGRSLIDNLGVPAIDPNLFYHSSSCLVLGAIAELHDEGAPIDLQIVTERLRKQGNLEAAGGAAAVTALGIDGNGHLDVARFNLNELRGLFAKRKAARIADRMQRGDIDLEDARKALADIMDRSRRPEKSLIEFRSPLQLKNFIPPPGLVLVGDCHIVRGSVFVIGGPPGVGKSRASVALAEAGATGKEWFGLSVNCHFKTMIIQTENGLFRLSKEFGELDCDALENYVCICPPPPFGLCLEREDFRAQLSAAIQKFQPDVIILDPWNAAARDDRQKDYLDTFAMIRSIVPASDDSPAIGVVAHTRKPKGDERKTGRGLLNDVSGSHVLVTVPRTVFIMQAASDDTEDNRVVWTCCKNNDGELGSRSAWERRNGLFAPVPDFDFDAFDAPDDGRESVSESDLAAIFENGALTKAEAVKELAGNTGASRASCYRALKRGGRFSKHLRFEGEKVEWQP
jgi:hypothetical protein